MHLWKRVLAAQLLAVSAGGLCCSQSNPPPQPGLLANTLTAPRVSARDKLEYRVYRGLLVRGAIGAVFAAGISQARDAPKEWGGGAAAFGKRYAGSLGTTASRQTVTGMLEVITGQDPRFYPSTDRAFKLRLWNAARQVFLAKDDEGLATVATSKLVGAFAAGQIANAWSPASSNSTGDGFKRAGLILAGDAGVKFLTEFVPLFRDRVFRRNNSSGPPRS